MGRHADILYTYQDCFGQLWDVREERPTRHGWPVLLGWPQTTQRGPGGGGPGTIPTPELVAYLETNRLTPCQIDLPLGRGVIKRLRRLLNMHWHVDNNRWWDEHPNGPGKSCAALSMYRKRHGVKTKMWTPAEDAALLALANQGITCNQIADHLMRSESGVRIRLWRLRKKGTES